MSLFGNLFLSVGAMKAGTTWLYALLRRHPGLHFTPEKEIHYFYHRYVDDRRLNETRRMEEARNRYLLRFDPEKANIDVVRRNLRWVGAYLDSPADDFWYRNLFQLHGPQRWACDFSNLNALLPAEAWPKIEDKCDRLRVLYTMRDPIKRLWSHTKFHLQFSGEVDKLNTWKAQDYERFLRQDHVWDNAEYGQILRNLKTGLSKDALKIMFYENMHADQRGSLAGIENFLGIANHNYPDALLKMRFTESVKLEMPDFFPELVAKDMARIQREVEEEGFVIPEKWMRF